MIELKGRNRRFPAGIKLPVGVALAIVAAIMVPAVPAQNSGNPYPRMAPMDQYLMTQDAEVALARSAAPESVSKDAEVLVMDRHGYRTAVKGSSGFVCAVQRSWTAGLDDPDFWNPKLRAPICFNAAAARSYLPRVIKRTAIVLAGKSKEQLSAEMKAAFEANQIPAIEPGSMAYMLSKQGYLSDRGGHWHPHIMIFVSETEPATWGANLPGSPVFGASDHTDRVTIFPIPVPKWSDGSPDSADSASHSSGREI
jgi:hypothetical protein